MAVDYRELLIKYIYTVGEAEGVSFIDHAPEVPTLFTPEEWLALQECDDVSRERDLEFARRSYPESLVRDVLVSYVDARLKPDFRHVWCRLGEDLHPGERVGEREGLLIVRFVEATGETLREVRPQDTYVYRTGTTSWGPQRFRAPYQRIVPGYRGCAEGDPAIGQVDNCAARFGLPSTECQICGGCCPDRDPLD